MPWWAIAYLVILTMVVVISVIKDYRDQRSNTYMLGELASGALGFLFVLGYWRHELAATFGMLIIPLLLYTITWDQYALSKMKPSAYADLTEQENRDMDRYSKIFAVIFISPTYIAGGLLAYRLLNDSL